MIAIVVLSLHSCSLSPHTLLPAVSDLRVLGKKSVYFLPICQLSSPSSFGRLEKNLAMS